MPSHNRPESMPRPYGLPLKIDIRRLLDIGIALCAILLCAPALTAIALAVWLESGGPIVFSQTRLGQRGRHFRLHKFRKFHTTASAGPAVTVQADPRMTQVGIVLERTKLDELPQLFNVLKGDMSLVGPRPESLAFQDCFQDRFHAVLDHKPGLFGPCQVLFRNEKYLYPTGCDPEQFYREALFPMKAQLDLGYFPSRTLASDASWMLRGIVAVLGWAPTWTGTLPSASNMETLVASAEKEPRSMILDPQ